jgi:peptidoglycan/LPS O-acetylase OafA/YrhL
MNSGQAIAEHQTNLDFVRAVAVLMVVSSHLAFFFGDIHFGFLEPALFGKLGVLIFFVHSGIVNMFSIERHVHKYGKYHLFWAFVTRRSFRIYPLSLVIVLLLFLTHWPASRYEGFSIVSGQHAHSELVPSLLLIQNFFRFDQILGPLWSLPYEVQIYCLFPALYLLLCRLSSTKMLVFAWALLAAVDHVIAPHLDRHANVGQFLVIPDLLGYFLLFLAGLYAYKEMQTSRRVVPFWVLPVLLAFICVVWCLSYGDHTKWVLVTFCLGAALPFFKDCKIAPVNWVSGWVAKYSYGIYLLHFPAIWLAFARCLHSPMVARAGIFVAATFGGSVLVYYAIEKPMIRLGNRAAMAISRLPAAVAYAWVGQ